MQQDRLRCLILQRPRCPVRWIASRWSWLEDIFGAPIFPGAYIAVQSGFLLGQVMVSTGASTLAWSYSYSKERARRLELTPTLGGLSMSF